ncbi:MAG: Uma2 family endonuclease, partial [Pirellulales bacterium]
MSVLTRFTLEQYEKMIGAGVFDGIERQRVEFIRGEIVQMTPVGNRHRAAVIKMTDWSYDVVDRANVQISVQSPILIPNLDSMPEPDIA